MKRRRWAWNIFCAFSLLIFATSVTLWVRSYFVAERIEWRGNWGNLQSDPPEGGKTHLWAEWSRGTLELARLAFYNPDDPFVHIGWSYQTRKPTDYDPDIRTKYDHVKVDFIGFHARYLTSSMDREMTSTMDLAFPLWLFLIFAVPPLVWWRQRRKRLGPAQGGRGFPLAAEEQGFTAETQRTRRET